MFTVIISCGIMGSMYILFEFPFLNLHEHVL